MRHLTAFFLWIGILVICQSLSAADPFGAPVTEVPQEMLAIDIVVEDADGHPVVGAKVTPWAIRSAEGHGLWSEERAGCDPPETARTNGEGRATVTYPKYANLAEQVRSTAITVNIDHEDHPFVSHEDITVPAEDVHQAVLPAGVAIDLSVSRDGQAEQGDNIYAMTTGGRGWHTGFKIHRTESGDYRILPLAEGKGQFFLVRIEDDVATHFSPMISVDLDSSAGIHHDQVKLRPATTIHGRFSDNVPRPVKNGRVKVQTISSGESWDEVSWFTWARVGEDGRFTIREFPADEPIQITALCDGFIAKSGERPPMVSEERARGAYWRPQAFAERTDSDLLIDMEPMSQCKITVTNFFGNRLADVHVLSNPNVGWWNSGSQIYCHPLVRATKMCTSGEYSAPPTEGIFAMPFSGKTDKQGQLVISMPVGNHSLHAGNQRYQLPIQGGRRTERVEIVQEQAGSTLEVDLVLQPRGLDVLGDWEDLCGLVFG